MKDLRKSRSMWTNAGILALGAFLPVIQSAPPGTFAPWVGYVVSALIAGLGAANMALRVGDKRKHDSGLHPVAKVGP